MNTRSCCAALLIFWMLALTGCETADPTYASVENGFPIAADGGGPADQLIVYKLWWTTTLFRQPLLPGTTSGKQRVVTDDDYAYALVARGWDAQSRARPEALMAMRSQQRLSVQRGKTLHIRVSDQAFLGNCAAGQPLAQDEADFVTERIFPGEFVGLAYDAASCEGSRIVADAGTAEAADGGADQPLDAATAP